MTITVFDYRNIQLGDTVFVRYAGNKYLTVNRVLDRQGDIYHLAHESTFSDLSNWYQLGVDFEFVRLKV